MSTKPEQIELTERWDERLTAWRPCDMELRSEVLWLVAQRKNR